MVKARNGLQGMRQQDKIACWVVLAACVQDEAGKCEAIERERESVCGKDRSRMQDTIG